MVSVGNMSVEEFQNKSPDPSTQSGQPPRRVIKTHAHAKIAPWRQDADKSSGGILTIPNGAKVILITRNPMDTCVSTYHHIKTIQREYIGDMKHFALEVFKTGKVESNSFWDWHRGWLSVRDTYNSQDEGKFLWMSYEEILQDRVAAIKKVGKFILPSLPSPEVIDAVAKASSFEVMKAANKSVFGKEGHIREGKVGKWRDALGDEVAEELLAHHKTKCAELEMDPTLWTVGFTD